MVSVNTKRGPRSQDKGITVYSISDCGGFSFAAVKLNGLQYERIVPTANYIIVRRVANFPGVPDTFIGSDSNILILKVLSVSAMA